MLLKHSSPFIFLFYFRYSFIIIFSFFDRVLFKMEHHKWIKTPEHSSTMAARMGTEKELTTMVYRADENFCLAKEGFIIIQNMRRVITWSIRIMEGNILCEG